MVSFAPLAPPDERQVEKLHVETFASRQALGVAAAEDIAAELRTRLASQDKVRMVFAAAPSQSEVLAALVAAKDVDWTRVEAFHMDDYIGLPESAPERFANWLDRNIFDHLPFAAVHHINPGNDVDQTVRNYEALLRRAPIDVIQLGIGVNGHIAFNDPPVADFNDPTFVKVVELDLACRQQQVDDDCFARLEDVPLRAITLTIPCLTSGRALFCMVPGAMKRDAVRAALEGPVTTACPASILRRHDNCTLYLDRESDPNV